MSYEKEMEIATYAARKAGDYLIYASGIPAEKKFKEGQHNFALEADKESEKLIIEILQKEFPQDHFLSEEGHHEIIEGKRMWIIDPLDGTRNYAHGIPYFSVVIALYEENEVKIGVVFNPPQRELYQCIKGQGVYLNGNPLKMKSPDENLKSSLVMMGFAYQRGEEMKNALTNVERVVNASEGILRFSSAATDLCWVAAGRIGAFFEEGLKPWDVAAGSLFIEEMGGVVSGYNRPLDMFRMVDGKLSVEIMVSKNEEIHSELEELLEI